MIDRNQKETQTKLTKNLLDMIILENLQKESMHGYQILVTIRKGFGVYFGPSTIYPLLCQLEKNGYLASVWNMGSERPRKVYTLTEEGKRLLKVTQDSLLMICNSLNLGLANKTQASDLSITVKQPLCAVSRSVRSCR